MDNVDLENAADRVAKLANVAKVTIGPDTLSIVALDPVPFEGIREIVADVPSVDISIATPVAEADAERFRPNPTLRELYDRDGKHLTPDDAKSFAAACGIIGWPTLSALYHNNLGVLFRTVEDAETYDRINAPKEDTKNELSAKE